MFDQLVVSARPHHKHPTAKIFLGTSVLYILCVSLAFAVSVLVSDPKLADTGGVICHVAGLPPATGIQPPKHDGPRGQPAARPDPNKVLTLDKLMGPRVNPPLTPIDDRWNTGPGSGFSDSPTQPGPTIGSIDGNRTIEAPPKPDPPKPKSTPPPTNVDNKPVRLSSTVLQGKAIERRTPPYPELPRQIKLGGEVSVEVIISPEGRVESARAVSGHPMLVKAAVDAARGWRFEPTLLNGLPVRVTGVITFVFKLGE